MARGLIVFAGAVGIVVAGCAEPAPPTLAEGSVEAAVPGSVWPDDPSIVTDVACPGLDPALIAQATTCTALLGADPVTVDIVIDDAGAATARVREPLFVVADAADQLVERLRTDLSIDAIEATCREAVVVAEAGRSMDCSASRDDDTIDFEVVLDRADGTWTLRLAG